MALKAYTKMYLVPEGVYNRLFGGLGEDERKNLFNLNEMSDQNITKNQKPPKPPAGAEGGGEGDGVQPTPSTSASGGPTDFGGDEPTTLLKPPSENGSTDRLNLDNENENMNSENENHSENDNSENDNSENDNSENENSENENSDEENFNYDSDRGNSNQENSDRENSDEDDSNSKLSKWTQTEGDDDVYRQLADCQEALAKSQTALAKHMKTKVNRVTSRGKVKKLESIITRIKKGKPKRDATSSPPQPDSEAGPSCRKSLRLKEKEERGEIRKWGGDESESEEEGDVDMNQPGRRIVTARRRGRGRARAGRGGTVMGRSHARAGSDSNVSLDENRVRRRKGIKRKASYVCELCLNSFKSARELSIHYARVHDRVYNDNSKKIRVNM